LLEPSQGFCAVSGLLNRVPVHGRVEHAFAPARELEVQGEAKTCMLVTLDTVALGASVALRATTLGP
jgi:hypothetical protein